MVFGHGTIEYPIFFYICLDSFDVRRASRRSKLREHSEAPVPDRFKNRSSVAISVAERGISQKHVCVSGQDEWIWP